MLEWEVQDSRHSVKLSPKEPEKIDYVIANCAECEPYITADYRRMLENTEDLVSGMRVVLKLFDNAKGIFGVEDNKKDCIAALREAVKDEPRMEVMELQTKYPQGGERQLIYATTKRAINSKMLPADAGCVVDNVETMIGISNAVLRGIPSMERVVTVSGDAVAQPSNFKVLFGTNQQELVDAAGGFTSEPEKIISGGPMMGFSMFTLDTPITKTTSSILGFKEDIVSKQQTSACINCGRCVDACPIRLIPSRLADHAEHHAEEAFVKLEGLECIECGSCSYVCPARRQLKQSIGSMKKDCNGESEEEEIREVEIVKENRNISASPHVRDKMTTDKIMYIVFAALLPATVFGVYNFGVHALLVVIVTTASAVLWEALIEKLLHKPITIKDGSAAVTGLLLALNLPPMIPLWIGILGSAFAIIIVKQLFGGLGQNFMNPALGARCFLLTFFYRSR